MTHPEGLAETFHGVSLSLRVPQSPRILSDWHLGSSPCSTKMQMPQRKICRAEWLPPDPILRGFSWEDVYWPFLVLPEATGRSCDKGGRGCGWNFNAWLQEPGCSTNIPNIFNGFYFV